ncbi:MAG: sulfotransferase [Ekhidna sp.]|uniref:sulfotransferase family protein n=1 Tax=Ekhidna sp. TaxID=2608089 RepID=UPI0032EABFAA
MTESHNDKIVFLTYLSRSGSTLLSNNLNQHPEICVTQEGEFPGELLGIKGYISPTFNEESELAKYLDYVWSVSRVRNWKIEKQDVMLAIDTYPTNGNQVFHLLLALNRKKHKPKSSVLIYKGVPAMPWEIANIAGRYPKALFINLIRDPRAIEYSQSNNKLPYENRAFSISPLQTAYEWKKSIAGSYTSNDRVLNIKFEDFIHHNEETIHRICYFLGLNSQFMSEDRLFSMEIPEEEQYLHKKVDQKPDASRIDAWKESKKDIKWAYIERVCAQEMTLLGYELEVSSQLSTMSFLKEWVRYKALDSFYKVMGMIRRFLVSPAFYLKKIKLLLEK